MKVGQFIYLKSDTTYAEIYDAPALASSVLGFTAGYVGVVKTLNVAGVGENTTFIGITDAYNKSKYINAADSNLFDFTDTDPAATTGGTGGSTTGGTTSGNGGTIDKIATVLEGLFGIFKKTTANGKTGTGASSGGSTGGSGSDSGSSGDGSGDPQTGNNPKSSFSVWFGKNWYWAIPAALLIPGGIIWAIVASINKAKANKALLNSNTSKQIQ